MTDLGKVPPLAEGPNQPTISAPSTGPFDSQNLLSEKTYNHPPADDWLSRQVQKTSDTMYTAIVSVDDIIPPSESKRYNRYVTVHRPPSFYSGIELRFTGTQPAIHSLTDAYTPPVQTPLNGGIRMLDKTWRGKSPLTLDQVYEIKLLKLQCTRVCVAEASPTTTFMFTNGSQKTLSFPCEVAKNLYIAFDVINRNSAASAIVRFDVMVLMRKAATSSATPSSAVGGATRMTPGSTSGTSPIGGP